MPSPLLEDPAGGAARAEARRGYGPANTSLTLAARMKSFW